MADMVSLGAGLVSAVIDSYTAVWKAYNTYLDMKDFPSAYQEIRIGLLIEQYKLELWANHVLSEEKQKEVKLSRGYWPLWKIFESIFNLMLESFQVSDQTMEACAEDTGLPKHGNLTDEELLQRMSLAVKSPPKHTFRGLSRTVKFVLRDKRKMEQLVKKLGFWNDSLDRMTSRLDQQSSRRRLRTRLFTNDVTQLQRLEGAAKMFNHPDLQQMAGARNAVVQGTQQSIMHMLSSASLNAAPDFRLEISQLMFQGIPHPTNQTRAMAIYGREEVIIDWRCCQDDTWRKRNPAAFQHRTANLTQILNRDLSLLNLSVLQCVGYLDHNTNITGYAFRVPPDTPPGQQPLTLHQLLTNVKSSGDIPSLGERFELAKALVSTVFEIHNIGWMHKNIQPKNVLFWPKQGTNGEPDIIKPYLLGFDISRPDQPGETSEKPPFSPEDDLYRHPNYKGERSKSFQPSFDIYSLGIVLFEIALWRNVGSYKHRASQLNIDFEDPQFIEKTVVTGPIMELKRYTGNRYRDVVMACLNQDFDAAWENNSDDRQEQLKSYLGQVQDKIVDALAYCSV